MDVAYSTGMEGRHMDHLNMDADDLQNQLYAIGAKVSHLAKKGICVHGWRKKLPSGLTECLHCHKIAAVEVLDNERDAYI